MVSIEIESIHTNVIIEGETWITVNVSGIPNTPDTTYEVLVEWTKLPDKHRIEEAFISRVHEITENEDHWYENGEWENIEFWDKIEEKVYEAFDKEFS